MTFQNLWQSAQQIPTVHMPEDHCALLYQIASTARGNCVEIGSWAGRSSAILGTALKKSGGHLFCVDHWNKIFDAEVDTSADIWTFWNHVVDKFSLTDCVTALRGLSVQVASQWNLKDPLDLLFIDGAHVYAEDEEYVIPDEFVRLLNIKGWRLNGQLVPVNSFRPTFKRGVKVDFDNWAPKLKKGGHLIMHDVNRPEHPGVNKVWQEEIKNSGQWTVLFDGDGIGWARKEYTTLRLMGSQDKLH